MATNLVSIDEKGRSQIKFEPKLILAQTINHKYYLPSKYDGFESGRSYN